MICSGGMCRGLCWCGCYFELWLVEGSQATRVRAWWLGGAIREGAVGAGAGLWVWRQPSDWGLGFPEGGGVLAACVAGYRGLLLKPPAWVWPFPLWGCRAG